jgi:hypothetical protein
MSDKLDWTVKFSIDKKWVKDGFNLTNALALGMLEDVLPYGTSMEFSAKVIKSPDPRLIKKVLESEED